MQTANYLPDVDTASLAYHQVKLQLSEEGWARRSEKTVLQALVRLADMYDSLAAAAAAT